VIRFLTPEWVDALDRAAPHDVDGDPELEGLVIEYDVDDFRYHVAFSPGAVRVRPGEAEDPTVTFHCDRATAVAIARGDLSAQRAFMAGRLRIGGDATALLRAQAAVAVLPDLFTAVRPETEW
jgi:putative sterol carrier protein